MKKSVPNWFRRRFCALSWRRRCKGIRNQELHLNGEVSSTAFVCSLQCAEAVARLNGQVVTGESITYSLQGPVTYTSGDRNKYQT